MGSAEVPKEFQKVSTEKSGFRLHPLRRPLTPVVIPQAGNPRLGTDRASHFPIRHWKNVSIELEYITAAGGRGDPGRIRPVRGGFPRIIFLVHTVARGAASRISRSPPCAGEGERHSSHLFVHELPAHGSRAREYFFLSTSRNSGV